MNQEAWEHCPDVRQLLRYAAPRLARQHLCLALCELAQPAVERHLSPHPDDWAPAWGLASLRAWSLCFLSDLELGEATRPLRALGRASTALDRCVSCAVDAALWRTTTIAHPLTWAFDSDPNAFIENAVLAGALAARCQTLGGDTSSADFAAQLERGARALRRVVPWPTQSNREWTNAPGIAWSGEYVLRIDGREVGDVVYRRDFASLEGARAVAFDAAQVDGEPESALQVAHRRFIEDLRRDGELHRAAPSAPRRSAPARPPPQPQPSRRPPRPKPPRALDEPSPEERERLRELACRQAEAARAAQAREDRRLNLTWALVSAAVLALAYGLQATGLVTTGRFIVAVPLVPPVLALVAVAPGVARALLDWPRLDRRLRGALLLTPFAVPFLAATCGTPVDAVSRELVGTALRRFDTELAFNLDRDRLAARRSGEELRAALALPDADLPTLERRLRANQRRQRELELLTPLPAGLEPLFATLGASPLLVLIAWCLALGAGTRRSKAPG